MSGLNFVLDTRPAQEVSDLEIVAYTVRLCRAADSRTTGRAVMGWLKSAFPDAGDDRLRQCAVEAAKRMMQGLTG